MKNSFQNPNLVSTIDTHEHISRIIALQCVFITKIVYLAKLESHYYLSMQRTLELQKVKFKNFILNIKATSTIISQKITSIVFKLGIIGCGTIGSLIVETLLSLGILKPKEIIISTRRPQTLQHFKNIVVVTHNETVVKDADLVILCCLPNHIPYIVNDIQMKLRIPMISCVAGHSYTKLVQLFKSTMIIPTKVQHMLSTKKDKTFWKSEEFIRLSCSKEIMSRLYYAMLTYYENKLPIEVAIRYKQWFNNLFYKIMCILCIRSGFEYR